MPFRPTFIRMAAYAALGILAATCIADAQETVELFATDVTDLPDGQTDWRFEPRAGGDPTCGSCVCDAVGGNYAFNPVVGSADVLWATNFAVLTLPPCAQITSVRVGAQCRYDCDSDGTGRVVRFRLETRPVGVPDHFDSDSFDCNAQPPGGEDNGLCQWHGVDITGGRSWTADEVNALQVGIRRVARSGESTNSWLRVNAMRILVTYELRPPVFFSQPVGATVCEGSHTLCAAASNATHYQWYADFGSGFHLIGGATMSCLQSTQSGQYFCRASNGAQFDCVSDSAIVGVSFTANPVVQGPDDMTICDGGLAHLCVDATPATSYEWYRDGVLIPGATGSCYDAAVAGNYHCDVAHSTGSVSCSRSSPAALVTVVPTPVISGPGDASVCEGTSIPLCVNAAPASSYQWFRDQIAIPGATGRCYDASLAGQYACRVSNQVGGLVCEQESDSASVDVVPRPVIVEQPQGQVICQCDVARLCVIATDATAWQWHVQNGQQDTPIPGATDPCYEATQSGAYYCVVSKISGAIQCCVRSEPATVHVIPAPDILSICAAPVACGGRGCMSAALSNGCPPLEFGWYRDGQRLLDNEKFGGTDTPTLCVNSVGPSDAGAYELRVLDACGGAASQVGQLSILTNEMWTARTGSGPAPRTAHGLTFDAARHVAVLFGGFDSNGQPLADTWEWDGCRWIGHAVAGPPPRGAHAQSYDSLRGVTVIFGGFGASGSELGDTWEWDGTVWVHRPIEGPAPRQHVAITYDSARHRTVLFGGAVLIPNVTYAPNAETWEYDGASWTLRASGGPPARYVHAMAFDPIRNRTVMFGGGDNGFGILADTWEWDGALWREVQAPGPGERSACSMAFDSARGRTVLFGGGRLNAQAQSVFFSDTWEFDGAQWVRAEISAGPAPRGHGKLAYDDERNVLTIFGGATVGEIFGDTWELSRSLAQITQQPQSQRVRMGIPFALSVLASGDQPLGYQWVRNGVAIGGATAPFLIVTPTGCSDLGDYYVEVCGASCGCTRSAPATVDVDRRGDMNCDCWVNNFDIDPFVLALVNPTAYQSAWPQCDLLHGDANSDGAFNNFDIDTFVQCILNLGCP